MIKISDETKKFVEKHIALIEQNNFNEFYRIAHDEFLTKYMYELYHVLQSVNINPLNYMHSVPHFFLYDEPTIKMFNIPRGVSVIGVSAFERSSVEVLKIPDTVHYIQRQALQSDSLKKIVFDGTLAEWHKIVKQDKLRSDILLCCSDKNIVTFKVNDTYHI